MTGIALEVSGVWAFVAKFSRKAVAIIDRTPMIDHNPHERRLR